MPHPIDPVHLAESVIGLLRSRVARLTPVDARLTSTWPEVLSALVARRDLSAEQTAWAMGEILEGAATPVQIAGFAVALRAKGETIDEVSGLVEAMYARATPDRGAGPAARRGRHRR